MNATIVASVLLLGGWVLPESEDTTPPLKEDLGQPSSVQQHEMRIKAKNMPTAPSLTNGEPTPPTRRAYDRNFQPPTNRGTGSASMRPMTMPSAPTDAGGSSSAGSPPTIPSMPTSPANQGSSDDTQGMSPQGGSGSSAFGRSSRTPSYGRGGLGGQQSFSQPLNNNRFSSGAAATPGLDQSYPSASPPPADKAFSGYKQAPAMSPYLQMYTSRTANGTIDPYNNGVRPMIEQGQANQKFSAQIGGLQNSLSRQGSTLNRLNHQEMPVQQGLVNPQYFINYQQYYPGAAQSGQTIGPQ